MGYYTTFSIVSITPNTESEAVIATIKQITEIDFGYSGTVSDLKWYDHEADMAEVSARHPGAFITMDGNGEEDGDVWRLYACNGKTEKVEGKIVFPKTTLSIPEYAYSTVKVHVCGVDVPVEIRHVIGLSQDALRDLAKKELKRLL